MNSSNCSVSTSWVLETQAHATRPGCSDGFSLKYLDFQVNTELKTFFIIFTYSGYISLIIWWGRFLDLLNNPVFLKLNWGFWFSFLSSIVTAKLLYLFKPYGCEVYRTLDTLLHATVSHQPRYPDLFSDVSWTRDSESFYKPSSLKQQCWDSASCFLASYVPPFCVYRLSLTLMMERIRQALKAWARNNTKWG